MRRFLCLITLGLGFLALPSPIYAADWERDTNRPGSDYRNFAAMDAEDCKHKCREERECKAWSYVKAPRGSPGRCWLKNHAPQAYRDACCTSGVEVETVIIDR